MDAFLRVLRVALSVLTDRILTLLALGMTFGLSLWAMHSPTWPRMGMAGFFAIAVFLPSLIGERRQGHETETKEVRE